jgi:hypothetical protein
MRLIWRVGCSVPSRRFGGSGTAPRCGENEPADDPASASCTLYQRRRGVLTGEHPLSDDLAILDKHADRVLFELDCLLADQARTGLRALALAPDIPTYHALLRGESVPIEQLRPEAVTRYGLRR